MLYREIIAVCYKIRTKHKNTLCGQNVELLDVKTGRYINKTITFKNVNTFTIPRHTPFLLSCHRRRRSCSKNSQRFLECQCLVSPQWDHTLLKVNPSSEVSSVSFSHFP
jgi:hypothetical protein